MSLFVAAEVGCNERGSGRELHESNLRLVAVLYNQYTAAHAGDAPQDADDFRTFVRSLGPGVLERAGLSGVDELLVSVRDGKAFAIKYQSEDWPLSNAIAYEQEGANGTRFVATELGGVSEISEEQFLSRLKQPN
jgi:hypothetical protein